MTIPASPTLEGAPYGAQPVVPFVGDQGGPYTALAQQDISLLSNASRTVTTSCGPTAAQGFRGMYVFFGVSVNPGGAQTLALTVEVQDPVLGTWVTLLAVPASAAPGGLFLLYPGAGSTPGDGVTVVRPWPLPRRFRVTVTHSGAGAWTYYVHMEALP